MLTDKEVKSLGPAEKPYKVADQRGLYLWVTPAGARSWRGKYRVGGKEKTLTLGLYPEVSLREARDAWDDARRALRRDGVDPSAARKAAKAEATVTFESIAREWHAKNSPRWKPGHAADVLADLARELFPVVGDKHPDKLAPTEMLAALRRVENRGAVDLAQRLRQRAQAACAYGIAAGLCTTNPAAAVRGALPPVVNGNRPAVLSLPAVRDVLTRAEAIPAHPATRLGLRLLALTCVRPGELRLAGWTELEGLDGPEPLWRIPALRMKSTTERQNDTPEHLVPLSSEAVACIKTLWPLSGRGRYLFPSARDLHRPMSDGALAVLLRRAGLKGVHVAHGFRSTFSTVANETFPDAADAIEAVLAHAPKDRVRSAYNRSRYLARRRELLAWWSAEVSRGRDEPAALLFGPRR